MHLSVDEFYRTRVETKGYERVYECAMSCIMDSLCDRGVIDSFSGQWTDLTVYDEEAAVPREYFKNMELVFGHVLAAASEVLPGRCKADKRTFDFLCHLDCQTASDVPGAPFHVDALNCLREPSYPSGVDASTAHNYTASAPGQAAPVYAADVGVTWGLKLWDDRPSVLRNDQHALSTAQNMLYNDLRRTCHFSVTIERTTVRLWCHTRSGSVFTQGFDIHTDARELVQLILFSTFATPYQLGLDPTVRRVAVGEKLHYEVDVVHRDGTQHKYRTVGIEYENPDAGLYSRAMRVFKAVRYDSKVVHGSRKTVAFPCENKDTQYVALRDYWVPDDARGEAEIQDEILRQLKDSMPHEDYEVFKRHFLTVVADQVITYEGAVGTSSVRAEVCKHGRELIANQCQSTPSMSQLHSRKHLRSVHEEYCEDLWKVDDPAKFYFALYQLMYILDKFRQAGYLHRDISMGNVVLHTFDKKSSGLDRYLTKIADLEYARSYERLSQLEPITGTSLFMAVELQAKKHLWANNLEEDTLTLHYFVHNPLHDVESVIWMAIYFAVRRCSRRVFEATGWTVMREVLKDVEAYFATIFVHSTHGSVERRKLISYTFTCQKLRKTLRRLHGDGTVFVKLIDAIEALRATYKAIENSRMATPEERSQFEDDKVNAPPRLSIDVFHQCAGVYETLREIFDAISQHFVGGEDSDPLIKISDIDLATGEIVSTPAEPETPPVTMGDDAASEGGDGVQQGLVGCAVKKLMGKRKNTDEGEVEAADEKRVFKRHCAKVPAAGD